MVEGVAKPNNSNTSSLPRDGKHDFVKGLKFVACSLEEFCGRSRVVA